MSHFNHFLLLQQEMYDLAFIRSGATLAALVPALGP